MPFVFALLLAIFCPAAASGAGAAVEPDTAKAQAGPTAPSTDAQPPAWAQKAKPAKRKAAKTKKARKEEAPAPSHIALSTVPISLAWPPQNLVMPMAPGEMVFGAVSNPSVPFRINGQAVKPHALGGFIAFQPIAPGTFTFLCELDLPSGATSFSRSIYVTPPLVASPPGPARIDDEARQPTGDLDLKPGDWLLVQMKGTPGGRAEFGIGGSKRRFLMTEANAALGVYQGAYQITLADDFDHAEVEFFLKNDFGTASAKAAGRVNVREGPIVAEMRSSGVVPVKTGPGEGYLLFPPAGTRFLVSGRRNGETRVQLSATQEGWIESAALQNLPAGTYPPRAELSSVKTLAKPDGTTVSIAISETIPFQVEESDDLRTVTVRLFQTVAHLNRIHYDPDDTFVRQINFRQAETTTAVLTLQLESGQRLWGTHGTWEGGALKLDLRRAPVFAPKGQSVFKGRAIVVDAGHMPSAAGAVGPRGVLEKDVNLAIAKQLAGLLSAEGANPIMTRAGDDEVGLQARARIAWEKRGELFVSVHNNSLADGDNPFARPHGFSVFYFHPHSFELARAVHESYKRRIPLPDEGLWYGNLLVARMTEMPAILTESAYMIFPEQEALLQAPSFEKRLAKAILEGARRFLETERARQARAPKTAVLPAPAPEPDPTAALQALTMKKAAPAKPRRKRRKP